MPVTEKNIGSKGSQFYLVARETQPNQRPCPKNKIVCAAAKTLSTPDEHIFSVSKTIQTTTIGVQEKSWEELAGTRASIPGSLQGIVITNTLKAGLNQADGVLKNKKSLPQALRDGLGDVSVGVASAGAGKLIGELCLMGLTRLASKNPNVAVITAVASEFVTSQALYYYLEQKREQLMAPRAAAG